MNRYLVKNAKSLCKTLVLLSTITLVLVYLDVHVRPTSSKAYKYKVRCRGVREGNPLVECGYQPMNTTEYSNLSTIVSIQWLYAHLPEVQNGSGELVVLDTSWTDNATVDGYHSFFRQGHIPGARYFDLNKCVQSTPILPRNIPNIGCFQEYIRSLGVYTHTRVILYDRMDTAPSGRTWWVLRLFGHERVSILDGGMRKWLHDGFRITTMETPPPIRSNFGALMRSELVRDIRSMLNNLYTKTEQVADARGERSFIGQILPNGTRIGGHIPGSVILLMVPSSTKT
ncbi:hypothetical protein ScPMuIL_014653 [Solemya velum]